MTQKGITPEINIPEERIERILDPSAVNRIFSNIISNAVKYSEGDFSVTMNTDGKIIFTNTVKNLNVVDFGKLFDRFYTVEIGRKSTGLGLSIASVWVAQFMQSIKIPDYILLCILGRFEAYALTAI